VTAVVICGLFLIFHSLTANAGPQPSRMAGITPTPTFTPRPEEPEEQPPKDEYTDPVIVKSADPVEAKPGEEVAFTLHIVNQGNIAAVDVVVTDDIPAYLEVLEVTTTQGEVTIDGQRVTVRAGTIGPEFEVQIVIHTRVRPETPAPLSLENVAILSCPNCHDRWARAEVEIIGPGLPVTGGLGSWWMVAACLGTALVGVSLVLSRREAR
jgi:uncharacterized repeat protein (TIGR01451 family)